MDSPKKQPDFLNTAGIVVIGLTGALLVYISFVGLQAFYTVEASIVEDIRAAEDKGAEFRTLNAEQEAVLSEYRWIDANKQTVKVPIEVAMRKVVEAAQQPGASLVPSVGAHDTPTVPAVAGRPPDNVQMPATPAAPAPVDNSTVPSGVTPNTGSAPTGTEGAATGTAPGGGETGQPTGTTSAPAGSPGAGAPGTSAPAGGSAQPGTAAGSPAAGAQGAATQQAPAQAAPAAGGNPGGNAP